MHTSASAIGKNESENICKNPYGASLVCILSSGWESAGEKVVPHASLNQTTLESKCNERLWWRYAEFLNVKWVINHTQQCLSPRLNIVMNIQCDGQSSATFSHYWCMCQRAELWISPRVCRQCVFIWKPYAWLTVNSRVDLKRPKFDLFALKLNTCWKENTL